MGWRPADRIAVALHSFKGSTPHHLTIHTGDLLYVMEEQEEGDWFRGYLYYQPSQKGIFPTAYVTKKEHTTSKIGSQTHVVLAEDDLSQEAKETLKEWKHKLTHFYVHGPRERYWQLLHHMEEVMGWRRTILHGNTTMEALQEAKLKLSSTLDQINGLLGCPLTPREEGGARASYQEISLQQLYKMHHEIRADSTADNLMLQSLRKRSKKKPYSHLHHLYMRVDGMDHQFPEDCEVFFSLCEGNGVQLSERYLVIVEKGGDRKFQPVGKRKSCAFTDLGSKDFQSGVFLVCQIIRRGKMLLDTKKWNSVHAFRRPYACGVLDVTVVLGDEEEEGERTGLEDCQHKMTMPLYLCGTNHESNFATFHTTIIQKSGGTGGQKPGCAITVSLRAFHRKELAAVRGKYPTLFTKETETVHKLGFPEVIFPGDARNDIFVTLDHGTFERGTKRAERNVEVAINVVDNTGTVIPKSIMVGMGTQPVSEFQSFIFYHSNSPKWNETFKLQIPFEQLPNAHLRIVFRHLAKDESREKAEKSFSFAYMKIMKDDGSILQDGTHELYVYETGTKRWYDPSVYLSQASCKEDVLTQTVRSRTAKPLRGVVQPTVQVARSFRETVHITTLTCSTKLTQRIELLRLLKWRQKSGDLAVILRNVVHVGGEEMVKFLHNTLDCLFDILSENHDKYGELVFEALIFVFGLLSDERFQHFTTVLDIYLEKHFSAILAYKFLLASFHRNLRELMLADLHQQKLIKVIKSMPFLFKFIVQSSNLHHKFQGFRDPGFLPCLCQLFQTFNDLMSRSDSQVKSIHQIQNVLLEQLPSLLPELAQVFPKEEIAAFLSQLLDSVRNTDNAVIPSAKLAFMSSVLLSPVQLLEYSVARLHLVPTLVSHLISHMDHRMLRTNYRADDRGNQEVVRCVGLLLGCLSNASLQRSYDDVQYIVPLMYPLLRLCKELPRHNPLSHPNLINFLTLMSIMTDQHFFDFFTSQQSYMDNIFSAFMMDLMDVLRSMICNPSYPEQWCVLYLVQNSVILRTLQNASYALLEYSLDDTAFTPKIWDNFFGLYTHFIVQDSLQLEQLSDYRQHQYQQQFGDMRVQAGKHVVGLWHQLGDKKGNFIPNFVHPFLEITLIKNQELRHASLPLVIDIMTCEQRASGNFKRVETEVYDTMDELISGGRGDEDYRELFKDMLHPMVQTAKLGQSGELFIDCISRLIGLLLDYRNVSSDNCTKDRRMGCMLNLLNFYREIEKEESYIRYIYKLAELHRKDHSYTEAGFTLLLRAEGLEWSDEILPPEGRFDREAQRIVKEKLYQEVVDLFDKGQSWEHGIPLCKELCGIYEKEFEYGKLATTLRREAVFFEKIISELRVEPEYFMVGSYGKGFPLFLRNKIFIHRGQPYERLESFIKRLNDEYPTAEVLKNIKTPEPEIMNSSGMYLQVRSVQAIAENEERFEGKNVPDSITRYFKANCVRKFRYDRPFHRGQKRIDCEIATLWIERTTFHTANQFPGEMAWFEVSKVEEMELDPLAIAIETMSSKIAAIQRQTTQHAENPSLNINPFSMLLSGVIDAAVGGGIKNYRIIFFADEYLKTHEEHRERVNSLKQLIEEQVVEVLKKGLTLLGERIVPSLKAMQKNLEEKLDKMTSEVFQEHRKKPRRSNTVRNGPLPRTPLEHATTLPNRRPTGVHKNMTLKSIVDPSSSQAGYISRVQRSNTTKPSSRGAPFPSPYNKRRKEEGEEERKETEAIYESTSSLGESSDDLSKDISEYERVEDFLAGGAPAPSVPPPPKYPAPLPPTSPGENIELDDDDYTPVKYAPDTRFPQVEGVREILFGELPLKMAPQSAKQLVSGSTPPLSQSPPDSGGFLAGPLIPPEPTSPPPSPPNENSPLTAHKFPPPTPPTGGADMVDGPSERQQPVVPRKKRREPLPPPKSPGEPENIDFVPPNVKTGSPPHPPSNDSGRVSNSLTTPTGHAPPTSVTPPNAAKSDANTQPARFAQSLQPALPSIQPAQPTEQLYFDRLSVSPTPKGIGSPTQSASPRGSSGQSMSPSSTGEEEEVHCSHPRQLPKNMRPPQSPQRQKPSGGEEIYFDSLAALVKTNKPVKPLPFVPKSDITDSAPPPVPLKRGKTIRKLSEDIVTPTKKEPPRPVARPRAGTLDRSTSSGISPHSSPSHHPPHSTAPSVSPPPPSLPPKPTPPRIPCKPPKERPLVPLREDIKPPARPLKPKPLI